MAYDNDLRTALLRATTAFALAANPRGQHLPLRVVAGLPASHTVVRIRAAAIGVERLQQEAALHGVARDNQPRDDAERLTCLCLVPLGAALSWNRREAHGPGVVAVAAVDVPLARRGEDVLHARAEELEVHRRCRRRHVTVSGQSLDPRQNGLVLGMVSGRPVGAAGVSQST